MAVATDLIGLGVRIPEEVTMASMDNSNLDAVLAVGATSVTLPSYVMGRTAMQVLLDRLALTSKRGLRHIVLQGSVSAAVSTTVA